MNWKTSESHPIRIAEIQLTAGQKLGLSFCPGKVQQFARSGPWKRDVGMDLDSIRNHNFDVVVSLIEDFEFQELEVESIQDGAVEQANMRWIWVPIKDGYIPTSSNVDGLNQVLDAFLSGDSVFVHCKGGMGRAGTVAAWLLTHVGRTAQEAAAEVRSVRPGAIENRKQAGWVEEHAGLRQGVF